MRHRAPHWINSALWVRTRCFAALVRFGATCGGQSATSQLCGNGEAFGFDIAGTYQLRFGIVASA
jgi:hypothetical protein